VKTKNALAALAALSQRTRLEIFRYLVQAGPEGAQAGAIATALAIAAPTLSFHLKELSHAELVDGRQEGRFVRYTANFAAMNGLIAYLTENCCRGQPDLCAPGCAPRKKASARHKRIPA
jgi:DNA-binding transcriptional ArsR family regulator